MIRMKYIKILRVFCPNHNRYTNLVEAKEVSDNEYVVSGDCGCILEITDITAVVKCIGEKNGK